MKSLKSIKSKTALNKLKRKFPYGWDLNIYRGCAHECRYCFARYSHKYMGSADFFGDIFYKENIADILDQELKQKSWKGDVINIGGVTDSYQNAEGDLKIMRSVLKVMLKYKNPIIISTKSDLILRDIDLISELAKHTYVNITFTVITMDEEIRKKIEPGSTSSKERISALKEFARTECSTGLHLMPIIPFLTDSRDNFDLMFSSLYKANVDYTLCGALYLRGETRKYFLDFYQKEFNKEHNLLLNYLKDTEFKKRYKKDLYEMINALRKKYNLSSSYSKPMKEKLKKGDSPQTVIN